MEYQTWYFVLYIFENLEKCYIFLAYELSEPIKIVIFNTNDNKQVIHELFT